MLLPADRLLELLQGELTRPGSGGDAKADVSSAQSAVMALQLLFQRERAGAGAIHRQCHQLRNVLGTLSNRLPPSGAELCVSINEVNTSLDAVGASHDLTDIEAGWRQILFRLEALIVGLRVVPDLDGKMRVELIDLLASWEADDLVAQVGQETMLPPTALEQIDGVQLASYLQDRFSDPGLQVVAFRPLPGGFGKQTYLFDVAGREFSGSFVMRRDYVHPLLDNDTHLIHNEFAVIRAVHGRGFPAPEALWLDTEHRLLPGGDFIVMRRSPGVSGGTVLKPNARVADDMAEKLARNLASLHALQPMEELAGLTESINRERWSMTLGGCVKAYLDSWLQLLQQTSHLPSPACMSQLGWLLDNVPEMPGRPALIHGDVGFHNFLIDDGHLTTLLDWEFSHLGDPAEDLASIRNNMGDTLDWDNFIRCYRAAGGIEIAMSRIHFFQVWGHVRNALATTLSAPVFIDGRANDIKFVVTPHVYLPMFIRSAQQLINAGCPG